MKGLALAVDATPSSAALDATWSALAGATKYQVSFTDSAGHALFSQTITGTESKTTAAVSAPLSVKVTVTPYAGTRRGRAASVTKALPDLAAPTGSYSVSSSSQVATLTQDALADNVPGTITRTVNWGDGTAPQAWATGTTLTHSYPNVAARYDTASVTLEDAAHNQTVVPVVVVIDDNAAPTASYSVNAPATVYSGWTPVALDESGLSDNWTPADLVTRVVDWGDGTAPEAWPAGAALSHVYTSAGVYTPKVSLTDEAGNTAQVAAPAPVTVVKDTTAPSATYAAHGVKPGVVFARWSKVTLGESALQDNLTPTPQITRVVDWGDGSAPQALAAGAVASHVYAVAGPYTPTVTLTDTDGNSAVVAATGVTVATDSTAPVATLKVPAKKKHVASWRKLHGTAKDVNGTGVRNARVRVIEKRTKGWYAYKPSTRTWVHTKTKALAWTKAGLALRVPGPLGKWTLPVAGLKKGTLLVRYSARDNVGNTSKPLVRSQQLTLP